MGKSRNFIEVANQCQSWKSLNLNSGDIAKVGSAAVEKEKNR